MQLLVRGMAIVMQRVMGTSGAESTNVAASIFMGQTEAPLTISPFLAGLTESELFTIMVSGMAHVSGAVMAAYVLMAHVDIEHLLTAVIMTAPATIMLAKILMPETGKPATAGNVQIAVEKPGVNIIDAAARGAGDGLQLALNIGAMLIAFLALIAMVNGIFGWVHWLPYHGLVPASMQTLRKDLCAGVLAAGRQLERCCGGRQSAGHAADPERIRRVHRSRARSRTRWIRGRSPSRRMRYAASRISVRSRSRSAGSARWPRPARPTLRGWG